MTTATTAGQRQNTTIPGLPDLVGDAVEETTATPRPELGGAEKTALLLLLLEEPEAASLLSRLAPNQVEQVGRAMLSVAEASPAMIESVLDEALEISREVIAVSQGPQTVRGLLDKALGDNIAAGMRERIGEGIDPPPFERLDWLEAFSIASLLEVEHPQVQALVLAQLPSEKAAQIMARMSSDLQPELVRRVAMLGPVLPTTLDILDESLTERITAVRPRQPLADLGGVKRAADLINMSGIDEEIALKALTEADPDAGAILAETLFTFDDLSMLDDKSLQNLVRALDAELLVPALRGAPDVMRLRLYSAMPQRAAQSLQDEVENRGPVKIEDAQAAQKEIAATARRMAAEGEVSLPCKGPTYV